MNTLYNTIQRSLGRVFEGGAAGHLAHIIDYTDLTRADLIDIFNGLLSGQITDVTEKIDGVNIQVTKVNGSPVFIRNKTDLNSEQGGMTASDMATKWASKPEVAKTYLDAAAIIEKVFESLPDDFFNPDQETRRVLNAECVVAGKTNIIPYASSMVSFHDIWIYKRVGDKWEKDSVTKQGLDKVQKACEKIDNAKLTPTLVIDAVESSNKLLMSFTGKLVKIMPNDTTISQWQFERFSKEMEQYPASLILSLFKRWFEEDKTENIRILKKNYPDVDIAALDKTSKDIVRKINAPLDNLFLETANVIIKLCSGLLNDGCRDAVIKDLKGDLEKAVKDIKANGSTEMNDMLSYQLDRLNSLGDEVNPTEGIVFSYKGKLMKLTGSFAPLNRILGDWKYKM